MKASFHKRLQQLETIRARELAVVRDREEQEEGRLVGERLRARIDALIQEHGMPEEPEDLAERVRELEAPVGGRAGRRTMSKCDQQCAAIDRCWREIAALEAEIRGGNPDLDGLCLALADWSGELRLLQRGEAARLAEC